MEEMLNLISQYWPYLVGAGVIYLIFKAPSFLKSKIIKRKIHEETIEVAGGEELIEAVEEKEKERPPRQAVFPSPGIIKRSAKKIQKQPYKAFNLLIFKVVEIPLNRAFVVSNLFTGEQKVIFGGKKGGARWDLIWFCEKVVLIVPTSELLLKMAAQQIFVRSEEVVRNGQSFAVEVDTDVYIRVPSEKEVASKKEAILNLATKEIPTADGVTINEAGLLIFLREYLASQIRQLAASLTLDELGTISAATLRVWAINITGSRKEPGLLLQKGFICTNIVVKQPDLTDEVRRAQLLTFEADQRKRAQLTDADADKKSAEIRAQGVLAVARSYVETAIDLFGEPPTDEEKQNLWADATAYARDMRALSGDTGIMPIVIMDSARSSRYSQAAITAELTKRLPDANQGGT